MAVTKSLVQGLQLQVLRGISASLLVLLGTVTVLMPPDSLMHLANRAALFAVSALVLAIATPESARMLGVGLLFLFIVGPVVRALQMDHSVVVLWMIVNGSHRLVPILSILLLQPAAAVVTAAMSGLAPVVVVALLRYRAGVLDGAILTNEETRHVVYEAYYLCVVVTTILIIHKSFVKALELASEALNAKAKFITNMNHEIRTPLVGVVSVTDLLLLRPGVPPPIAQGLHIVQASSRALLNLFNNILDLSAMQAPSPMGFADSQAQTRVPIMADLKTTIQETAKTFTAMASAKGLHYDVNIDDTIPPLLGLNQLRVQQILCNLLGWLVCGPAAYAGNAFKFTARGSVQLTVGFAPAGVDDVDSLVEHGRVASGSTPNVVHLCGRKAGSESDARFKGPTLPAWAQALTSRAKAALVQMLRRWWPWLLELAQPQPPPAPAIWIKVADTGVGIAPDQLDQVANLFHQADSSTTRRYGGAGLGLAVCKEAITLLHGDFLFASALDQGSAFVVVLPCAAVLPDPPAPPTPLPPLNTTDERSSSRLDRSLSPVRPPSPARPLVLIADDNPLNVRILQRQLELCGCNVVSATTGAECVDYIRRMMQAERDNRGGRSADQAMAPPSPYRLRPRHPRAPAAPTMPSAPPAAVQAIFMDLHMPVMDGLSATREIRLLEQRALGGAAHVLPILAVTSDDPMVVGEACRVAGMNGFLRKPVVLSELAQVVQRLQATAQ